MHVILVGKPEERHHLGGLGISGRIILKCTLKKYGMRMWTALI
jgi:hypothetical protein